MKSLTISSDRARNPVALYLASLAPGSRRTMLSGLNLVARRMTDDLDDALTFTRWSELRYEHMVAIRAWLAEEYAPATANRILSAVRQVLKQAWKLGQLNNDVYRLVVDIPSIQGDRLPAGRYIEMNEIAALMATIQKCDEPACVRDAALVAVLRTTGMRRSSLAALTLEDYGRETGGLLVRAKGNKQYTAYVVDPGARQALADWLALRGDEPGALFWPILKNGTLVNRHMTPEAIYHILNRRAVEAGVDSFSPHDFRRTFVSDLLDAGADIVTVQKLAGHANSSTTAKYDRRGEETKKQAAACLHVPYFKN